MKFKLLKIFLCLYLFAGGGTCLNAKTDFQQVGDILRFLPAPVFIYTLIDKDFDGSLQLAEGVIVTQIAVEAIKYSLQGIHRSGADVGFAKRPCCDDWKGFPSGHAAGAMSAAGFVYYHYGFVPSVPFIILAGATAASRVEAKKHSILQVTAGSAIAWGFAALFTKPKQKLIITPQISDDEQAFFGVSFSYRY